MPTIPFLETCPDSLVLHDPRRDTSVTRRELMALANAEAAEISKELKDDIVGPVVVGEADPIKVLVHIFACWAANRTVILVNPALKPAEQLNVLENTGAVHWLGQTSSEILAATQQRRQSGAGSDRDTGLLGPDSPALILMTSGTTGVPKGIVHTIRSLQARAALNIAVIGSSVMSRTLDILPMHFGHGLIGNVLTPMAAGGSIVLLPSPSMNEIAGLGALIDRHQIGFMSSVPSAWGMILRLSQAPEQGLERVHVGSAPLSMELWRRIAEWSGTDSVYNMFGMTETANWIAGGSLADTHCEDGYVGSPWGGRFAVLIDDEVREGGRGEVLVSTPSIMSHYLDQPELTAEAFRGSWFRTGDIGVLSEGRLTLSGRIKNEINRAGIKILPEEIDMLLERHEAVAEACAFGIADRAAGELVAACVVLAEGANISSTELQEWCRERVRDEAVPSKIWMVDAIPRNDRGKIVRRVVRESVVEGSAN